MLIPFPPWVVSFSSWLKRCRRPGSYPFPLPPRVSSPQPRRGPAMEQGSALACFRGLNRPSTGAGKTPLEALERLTARARAGVSSPNHPPRPWPGQHHRGSPSTRGVSGRASSLPAAEIPRFRADKQPSFSIFAVENPETARFLHRPAQAPRCGTRALWGSGGTPL